MKMSGHFHAPAAVPIANEVGWAPELVQTILEKRKYCSPCRDLNSGPSSL